MQIETKNLSYAYNPKSKFKVDAVKNISLTVEEGEFLGIIGHTGSGKSTFIQHLNGLIKLSKKSGEITVGEFKLHEKKCNFKALRQKVGMVFQYPEYQLFAETVFEDVAFGLKNFGKYSDEEINSLVKEAIETVGLNFIEVKDKSPFDLSGGQKRRVAIAGVIVSKPEVLVLDEPVAGLDPKGKKEFFELLHKLHKSFVKTIIIVSHDMDNVCENCSKVAVFSNGELYAYDTPSELFKRYEELTKIGLDVPITAYLTEQLKKSGVNIESDFTIKDFTQKLIEKKEDFRK